MQCHIYKKWNLKYSFIIIRNKFQTEYLISIFYFFFALFLLVKSTVLIMLVILNLFISLQSYFVYWNGLVRRGSVTCIISKCIDMYFKTCALEVIINCRWKMLQLKMVVIQILFLLSSLFSSKRKNYNNKRHVTITSQLLVFILSYVFVIVGIKTDSKLKKI